MITIFGDPLLNPTLSGTQHGKNQTLLGIDNQDNSFAGDVDLITGHAKGGDDHLTGGNNNDSGPVDNEISGDATNMFGSAQGGHDLLTGGNNSGSGTVLTTFSVTRMRPYPAPLMAAMI